MTDERKPLTPRQEEAFDFVRLCPRASVRNLADHLGCKPNGAEGHLKALERKGWISRTPGESRSIQIVGGITQEQTAALLTPENLDGQQIQIGDRRYLLTLCLADAAKEAL